MLIHFSSSCGLRAAILVTSLTELDQLLVNDSLVNVSTSDCIRYVRRTKRTVYNVINNTLSGGYSFQT